MGKKTKNKISGVKEKLLKKDSPNKLEIGMSNTPVTTSSTVYGTRITLERKYTPIEISK
jgi:hypothetical protein